MVIHVARRARGPDGVVEPAERAGVDPDVLEADVPEPELLDVVEYLEAIEDRPILSRQHEDEVDHVLPKLSDFAWIAGGTSLPRTPAGSGCPAMRGQKGKKRPAPRGCGLPCRTPRPRRGLPDRSARET